MTEVLAIIPARGGSKSVPRKNIKLLNGKPMVYYSIEACEKSKYISRFVVSTEDAEIKEICESFGAEVINRPAELAQDETKTAPVMLQVVDELEKTGYKADYIVLIQPTSPFRTADLIDRAYEHMLANTDCDSCFTGFDLWTTAAKWRELKNGKLEALYDYHLRPRRQDMKDHYRMFSENGAFYAIKYDAFRKHKDFVGENPCIYLTNFDFDVDKPHDFERAEITIKQQEN